jgi:hypothetical protein
MPSRHVSLRMEQHAFERLAAESRRNREPLSTLAKRLIEEGLRMAAHPGIWFKDSVKGRRAALFEGPQVWLVVSAFPRWDDSWDIRSNETVGASSVTPYEIKTALKYYAEYPEEIDELIRANQEAYDRGYADWLREQALQVW